MYDKYINVRTNSFLSSGLYKRYYVNDEFIWKKTISGKKNIYVIKYIGKDSGNNKLTNSWCLLEIIGNEVRLLNYSLTKKSSSPYLKTVIWRCKMTITLAKYLL